MSAFELPEGFILLPVRKTHDEQLKKNRYGLSAKGEIFNVQTGETLTAPEGSNDIDIREDSDGALHTTGFHIPTLLMMYFGNDGTTNALQDRDPFFDKVLTDVTFTARNFRGLEGPYNVKGNRSFAVIISDAQVKELKDDGWTVREVESKKGERVSFVKVSFPIGFDISNIKLNGKALTSAEELNQLDLDGYEIMTGSLTVFGRPWEMPERTNNVGEVLFPARKGVRVYIVALDVTTKEVK
jgi:hypothetical protein